MEHEETVTIKKTTLWKYSTFALLGVVVILAILMLTGKSTTGNVVAANGAAAGAQVAFDASVFTSDSSLYPSLGPENAKHTVIEFADFQCPYCALAAGLSPWTTQYQSQYPDLIGLSKNIQDMAAKGEIRFIYVSMSFLGQESVDAAQAGLCANEQGKFWEMHDAIFMAHDGKENNGKYSKANLEALAAKISGIDTKKFNSCLESNKYSSEVQEIASAASSSGVSGTPTFIVDGKRASSSWASIQAQLK